MIIVDTILAILALALAAPALFLLIECVLALLPRNGRHESSDSGAAPRTFVVIPAHNEASGIAPVIANIRSQLADGDRVIVVADNCTDDTAIVARRAGADVIERSSSADRGKGFAIEFAVREIAKGQPPDVVILIDADCFISADGIRRLAQRAQRLDRPVQAEYLLTAPPNPSARSVISALAVLVKNRVRPRGLDHLCGACHLTGSGMAFPWRLLKESPALGANLVEDLQMGIELALLGHPATAAPEAQVTSDLPSSAAAAHTQRRRWEHGHLATMASQAPRLIRRSVVSLDPRLLLLAFDLMIPPLALLVLTEATASGFLFVYWLATGFLPPLLISLSAAACIVVAVMIAWIGFARSVLPLRFVYAIPAYIVWKLPLYLALARRGKHDQWERTQRDAESGSR